MPNSDHVIWKLARLLVVGGLFITCANMAYKNGWSKNDLLPLLTIIGGLGGFDALKQQVAPKPEARGEEQS